MASNARSFVGIIGGFWGLKGDPDVYGRAQTMAKEIGAALASAGFGLVVYFSNDDSLEPYVVTGYVNTLPTATAAGLIRVRYAQSQRSTVRFPNRRHTTMFSN